MEPNGEAIGPRITGMEHRVDEIREAVERISNHRDGSQNVTQIKFDGGRTVVTSLMLGLVAGVCLGVAVFSAVWVATMASNQQAMNRWMTQEVTAVRSYITSGKLAPMNPPPVGAPEEKK